VSFRYAHAAINGSSGASQDTLNAYQVSAYAGYAPGPAYLNGALVYGIDQYSGSRSVAFPGFTSADHADYDGHQVSAFAATGYHLYLGDGATVITPSASLQYTALNVNAYTESGDPAIDLAVNAQHYDLLQSGLGAKVARDVSLGGSMAIRPEAHVNWLHAFGDDRMVDTAAFTSGGPAFTAPGLAPGRETYNLGGGVTLGKVGRWSMEGAYDHFWRGAGYSSDQVMVNFVLHL
jgi:outer membrane autotransporter protein